MGRKTYEGTGILPGMLPNHDGEPAQPASSEPPTARPPATPKRAKAAPRFTPRRVAALFMAALAVLGASLYAFHRVETFLIRDGRFTLNSRSAADDSPSIEITGASHASRRSLEGVFTEDLGRSVYLMPLYARRDTLRTVDWVRDATVARVWPNRVIVQVSERTPVAFLTLSSSRFALIDADGVILQPAKDRFTLPVLIGVHTTDTLSVRRDRVHRMLGLMTELGAAGRTISEIDVSDRDNLKVSQPYEGRVLTLLLGDHNFAARYGNFVAHYKEIQTRLPGATTLDLRLEDRITVVE
ncbi:MAG: cell division protein FtsQ/DivIB [Bryobacteraceae bacterium]